MCWGRRRMSVLILDRLTHTVDEITAEEDAKQQLTCMRGQLPSRQRPAMYFKQISFCFLCENDMINTRAMRVTVAYKGPYGPSSNAQEAHMTSAAAAVCV